MSGRQAKHAGLIRINKTGEMRLKNKVGNAILNQNTYEERALRTRLQAIKRHQDRNDRYLAHKQLEFATNQVTASEERPLTTSAGGQDAASKDKPLSLPPINGKSGSSPISKSAPELRKVSRDTAGSGGAKGRWEKAISLVRHAVSQRGQRENWPPLNETQRLTLSSRDKTTNFPPIDQAKSGRTRKKALHRQVSLPEMIQTSRKRSQIGPQDPRFQRLEQCLQEGLTSASRRTETQGQPLQRPRSPNSRGVSTF